MFIHFLNCYLFTLYFKSLQIQITLISQLKQSYVYICIFIIHIIIKHHHIYKPILIKQQFKFNNHFKYRQYKQQMNQYRNNGGSSTSKSRANGFKSPSAHDNFDVKAYKKKYQKKAQQLMKQRQRNKQLEQMIEQMQQRLQKQQKQLQKKQQIEDVLLNQIRHLKSEVQSNKSNKTLSKQNSIEQKKSIGKKSYDYSYNNSSSQISHNNSGHEGKNGINGINFTLSDMNNQGNNSYQSEYSQNSYQHNSGSDSNLNSASNIKSINSHNNYSDQQSTSSKGKGQVGGYFGKTFNI